MCNQNMWVIIIHFEKAAMITKCAPIYRRIIPSNRVIKHTPQAYHRDQSMAPTSTLQLHYSI